MFDAHLHLGRVNTNHEDSGLLGTWSWNSSNFHVDDVMDESYTDANHKPIYTLDSLPKEIVEVSRYFLRLLYTIIYYVGYREY